MSIQDEECIRRKTLDWAKGIIEGKRDIFACESVIDDDGPISFAEAYREACDDILHALEELRRHA